HGNHDLNPNNIEKIVENFHGRDIQFMSDDNLKDDIKSCIDKLDRDNSAHDIELSEAHSSHQENELDTINYNDKKKPTANHSNTLSQKNIPLSKRWNLINQRKRAIGKTEKSTES
ncbi:hypothetical protein, partial [Vibrio sp. FF59]